MFGRLHGREADGSKIPSIGDRVFAGLLALPLIFILVQQVFRDAPLLLKLLAPGPVAIYVFQLARTDWKDKDRYHFTKALFIAVMFLYGVMFLVALLAGVL